MKFEPLAFKGRPEDEKNDCVARAFSVAAEVDYEAAAKMLFEMGRKPGKRTSHKAVADLAKKLKLKCVRIGRKMTLQKMLLELEAVKCCAINISGHMVPVMHGTQRDIFKVNRGGRRVIAVYLSEKHYFGNIL